MFPCLTLNELATSRIKGLQKSPLTFSYLYPTTTSLSWDLVFLPLSPLPFLAFALPKMTYSEIWLTYVFASRALAGKEPATQILELEYQGQKLHDLEDMLEHIFRQGYVEAKHRPSVWWEKHDGVKVKGSHVVEELLEQGVGRCEQTALKLVIGE